MRIAGMSLRFPYIVRWFCHILPQLLFINSIDGLENMTVLIASRSQSSMFEQLKPKSRIQLVKKNLSFAFKVAEEDTWKCFVSNINWLWPGRIKSITSMVILINQLVKIWYNVRPAEFLGWTNLIRGYSAVTCDLFIDILIWANHNINYAIFKKVFLLLTFHV